MWSAIMAQIDDVKKLFPQMDDKTAEIALECCNNNEVNVRFPDHPQILLSRRIRDDPSLLQRILDMGSGKVPLDMKSIQWVDPKKLPPPVAPQPASDEDNEEWGKDKRRKKGKKGMDNDTSDESVDFDEMVMS